MANIQIIQGGFEQKLKLQFAPGIKAGFPSPADGVKGQESDIFDIEFYAKMPQNGQKTR